MIPIFVGGCPRSGTTLLGAMLGAHRDVICPPEAPSIAPRALHSGGALPPAEVGRTRRAIQTDYKFRYWALEQQDLDGCVRAADTRYDQIVESYVRAFGRRHGRVDARFWVEHSPTNIMYVRRLRDAFPEARFVHLLRDGRAVAASILPLTWGPNTIIEAALQWASYVGHGLAAEQLLPASQIRRVTYEDLVTRPADVLGELCRFVGLDFDPDMTLGKGLEVPAYTRDQHALVGKPVDRKRSDRWRQALSARQIEMFEALTGDLLPTLGYDLQCAEARAPSPLEKVTMQVQERARQAWHVATLPLRRRRSLARLARETDGLSGQLK
jgi:hypothetical protein